MGIHEWRERTEDDELRLMRAILHGGNWRFEARLKSEPEFVPLDPPSLDDLESLRDVLWRKYKRGRVPHKQVLQVDGMIERAGGPGAGT